MKAFTLSIVLCILSVGIILRLHNLSPFTIYPDSYQSLVVAHNIATYHSVVGYLGSGGMVYPDFFIWTRPFYPLLIDFFTFFSTNTTAIAQSISFASGILLIVAVYLFVGSIFKSRLYGLAASLLAALSFNLTIWSGFIMTETTGVLFLTLFLWRFFSPITFWVRQARRNN